jgi:hypothetical protein
LAKYRPVEARELAQALIHTALAPEPRSGNVAAAPVIVVEGREIKKRARSGD